MSLQRCLDQARSLGVISAEEHVTLSRRYRAMIDQDGLSNAEARDRMAKLIKAEADQRERAALMTHVAIDRLLMQMDGWRDYMGRRDEATALVHVLENLGESGTFMQDVEGRREAIARLALAELKDLLREGRKGAFSGDLRRTFGAAKTRMDNIVREIHGQDTGDAKAKQIAAAWSKVVEDLRVRFNDAGGAIGKLQGGYLPQSHNRLALLAMGRGPWVEYMMEPGRLDRERMRSNITGEKLTDSQLREALEISWDRITTDGYFDADVSAQPQGMGAVYTQHVDHRFIHFASPDKWIEYNKRFGANGGDIFAAMMSHVGMMARDIAQMEILGPNPSRTLAYLKSHLRSKAANIRSNDVVLAEQRDELKRLAGMLARSNISQDQLIDRVHNIHRQIDELRASRDYRAYVAANDMGRDPGTRAQRYLDQYQKLIAELQEAQDQLLAKERGDPNPGDAAIEEQMRALLDDMREAISVATHRPGDRAQSWVETKIRRIEAMWDQMRGNMTADPRRAARWSSVRNIMSSAALGSAVISSITDPAFGQDMRLRMGMAMKESNFLRLIIAGLTEMITMGKREDAIEAGFGIDAALRTLHRQAREVKDIDHRFWTGWLTDRNLTWGGLLPWTQAGKVVFDMDAMRFFGDLAKRDWAALPAMTQRMLAKNGIERGTWDRLRSVPLYRGVDLRPADVARMDRELGQLYLQMILRAQRFAIPEATVQSSSVITNMQAGTLGGEIWRSMMQFKGFAVAVLMLHQLRIARELRAGEPNTNPAAYAATMFITAAFLGAVAIALKDIKDGRDPRKWLNEKTWLDPVFLTEAILQSGGLGIYGDFLRASENRMGGGLGGTVIGPLGGKIESLGRMGIAGGRQAMGLGKPGDERAQEELVRFFRSGVVPFSNLPYTSVIFQRNVMDQLQILADREAYSAFARTVNKRQTDYGQGYWYRPGTTAPQRAPDVSRVWATR